MPFLSAKRYKSQMPHVLFLPDFEPLLITTNVSQIVRLKMYVPKHLRTTSVPTI